MGAPVTAPLDRYRVDPGGSWSGSSSAGLSRASDQDGFSEVGFVDSHGHIGCPWRSPQPLERAVSAFQHGAGQHLRGVLITDRASASAFPNALAIAVGAGAFAPCRASSELDTKKPRTNRLCENSNESGKMVASATMRPFS
jgi:hypothetical protein